MKWHGYRVRLGGVLLAVALGAIAMLALPAIGIGKRGHDDHGPRPAGTIASFDRETHVLTVDLARGGEISALVVRRTQIRCGEDGRRHRRRGHRRGHGHGGDGVSFSRRGSDSGEDRSGPGGGGSEDEVGDDRGGRGEDEVGGDRGGRGPEPGEDDHVHGEDHHGEGHDHGRHGCNAGDLIEGAIVMKAEIVLTHGDAFFKKIGLLPPQAVEPGPEEPEML